MGRFSPTVLPGPSWTQGLEQATGGLAQSLIQRRQFNLAKQKQQFEEGMQQQDQARQNAQAGYDPTYIPSVADAQSGTVAPSDLSTLSNAGVSDASRPNYDPTKSLTYALLQNRNTAAMDRVQAQVAGREDTQAIRNAGNVAGVQARYGMLGPDGVYQPGVQVLGGIAQRQPGLDQRNDQFQRTIGLNTQKAAETQRHDRAMEARPVGGGNFSVGGSSSGGLAKMTPALAKQVSAQYTKLSGPQPTIIGADSTGKSVINGYTPELPPGPRAIEATHRVNVGMNAAGLDTLPNPAPGKSLAPKRSEDVPTVVPPTGNVKTLGNKTDQHVVTTAPVIPKNPTDSNTGAYDDEAKQYQAVASAIQGSSLSAAEKQSRLATLRSRYNARVAALAAPQK